MKKFILAALFILAFLERTVFDLGANVELITTAIVLSSFYTNIKNAFWLAFFLIATTDRLIGNSSIFVFTWTGFLIPALLTSNIIKKAQALLKNIKPLSLIAAGLVNNAIFYLWTNLGVWILDAWGMYPNNLGGLATSYINALPFLRNQLISTLIFIPAGYFSIELITFLVKRYSKNLSARLRFNTHNPLN